MGKEQSHKDSFDLELDSAASSSSSVQWMQFPTSSHIESLSNSSDEGYVTLIRSSAFSQSSFTESKPHLGCLLRNLASLQKGFPSSFLGWRSRYLAGVWWEGSERDTGPVENSGLCFHWAAVSCHCVLQFILGAKNSTLMFWSYSYLKFTQITWCLAYGPIPDLCRSAPRTGISC